MDPWNLDQDYCGCEQNNPYLPWEASWINMSKLYVRYDKAKSSWNLTLELSFEKNIFSLNLSFLKQSYPTYNKKNK